MEASPILNEEMQEHIVEGERKLKCSIVWSILPGLSFLFPFIGHLGITDSNGVVYDFAGSFFIHQSENSQTGFGNVMKYIPVVPEDVLSLREGESFDEKWDAAILEANRDYAQRHHNLILQNCHHHVAHVLNALNYRNMSWGTVSLILWFVWKGKYVSAKSCCITFFGFYIICAIVIAFLLLFKISL